MKSRSSIVTWVVAILFVAALMPISWASADDGRPTAAREGDTFLPLMSFAEPPTSTPTLSPTPTPTATPLPQEPPWTPVEAGKIAVLGNHSTYTGPLGRLVIVGEVQSGLAISAKLVRV